MNNNNGRQSINNYVYNKRRNREPEPPRNDNSLNFNNQNNNDRQETSSMYNSYVSENNYNSYTSDYQTNTYSGYNQSPQVPYNNYGQPPQAPYNNYAQLQQNVMPTYQNYNSSVPPNYAGGYHAIEVPIDRSKENEDMIIIYLFLIPFVLGLLFAGIVEVFGVYGIVSFLMGLCFVLSFVGLIAGIVISSERKNARLRNSCTVPVTGRLVGYDSRRTGSKHRHYMLYAPKYEIFINNRYEIRTLDRYTTNQNFASQMFLLANPNGYEIIQGGNGGQNQQMR